MATDVQAATPAAPKGTRKRLDHIDAMRPVKQSAVISTHALIFFAPAALVGLAMLTRFARDAFLFVSACMLTYSYRDMAKMHLATYWKRRSMAVVVPYVCWTAIYFCYTALLIKTRRPYVVPRLEKIVHHSFSLWGLHHFLFILATGYYQLYYLLVIMQFYVLFPLLLPYFKRHPEHHLAVLVAVAVFQFAISYWVTIGTIHLDAFWATRMVFMYPLYLIGGMVVALRLDDFDRLVRRFAKPIAAITLAFAAVATWIFFYQKHHDVLRWLQTGRSVFSLAIIPYDVFAIFCLYLLGVYLVSPKRSLRTRAMVQSGSDNSYGVYLSQLLWIPILVRMKKHVPVHVPWVLMVIVALVVTYAAGLVFTALVARTPLAKAIVGRSRASWQTLLPRRTLPATPLHADTGDSPLDVVPE